MAARAGEGAAAIGRWLHPSAWRERAAVWAARRGIPDRVDALRGRLRDRADAWGYRWRVFYERRVDPVLAWISEGMRAWSDRGGEAMDGVVTRVAEKAGPVAERATQRVREAGESATRWASERVDRWNFSDSVGRRAELWLRGVASAKGAGAESVPWRGMAAWFGIAVMVGVLFVGARWLVSPRGPEPLSEVELDRARSFIQPATGKGPGAGEKPRP